MYMYVSVQKRFVYALPLLNNIKDILSSEKLIWQ
jgi:hypothetical protein